MSAYPQDSLPLYWNRAFFKNNVTIGVTNAPATGMLLTVAGNVGPEADNTRDLGSGSLRWHDAFIQNNTVLGTTAAASGMKLTVAGNAGPEADATRNLGSSSLRWNDIWANRCLAGHGGNAGSGIFSAALQSATYSLFSDVAESAQLTYGGWLIRRSRGTLASKTNVITGDYLATIEVQPDPAGGGGVVQGAGVAWVVESRTGTTAIGVQEQHLTRGNAAGAAQTLRFMISADGNVVIGNQGAALATTATDGFLYPPSCAGVPTGAATAYTGAIPMVIDTTNLRIYCRIAGTWRLAQLT